MYLWEDTHFLYWSDDYNLELKYFHTHKNGKKPESLTVSRGIKMCVATEIHTLDVNQYNPLENNVKMYTTYESAAPSLDINPREIFPSKQKIYKTIPGSAEFKQENR